MRGRLAQRHAVCCLPGAGASRPAGYPLWRQLLEKLKDVLVDKGVDSSRGNQCPKRGRTKQNLRYGFERRTLRS